jgi:PhoH-like ATPase
MSEPQRKIFVLDTSVILHDFNAIQNFQEHDVAVPITVLEELDGFKKGNSVLNLQAREFIRQLDKLAGRNMLNDWIPLDGPARGKSRVLTDEKSPVDAGEIFGTKKPDHRILNAAITLARAEPDRRVILVSKDINLRLKARALNLAAEDYETIKIKDVDHLYKGKSELEVENPEVIDRLYREEWVPVTDLLPAPPRANQYFILRSENKSALAFYNPRTDRIQRVPQR